MAKGHNASGDRTSIEDRIYSIRKQDIMFDRDVAELYDVDSKAVREAVRNNGAKFPADCMFEMTPQELEKWRSRFGSSQSWQPGLHRPPFCFTWKGIISVSFFLDSEIAKKFSAHLIQKLIKLLRAYGDGMERVELLEELLGDQQLMMLLNWGKE